MNDFYKELSICTCTDMEWSPKGIRLNEKKGNYKIACVIQTDFCYFLKPAYLQKKKELENHAPKLMVGIFGGGIKSNLII